MLKWSLEDELAQDDEAVEKSERVDLAEAEKKLAVLVHFPVAGNNSCTQVS